MALSNLSDKTKVVLSIPQWAALIIMTFGIGGTYAMLNTKVNEVESVTKQNCIEIERIKKETQLHRNELLILIQDVRESQIRIEGKLDLKQDRFK